MKDYKKKLRFLGIVLESVGIKAADGLFITDSTEGKGTMENVYRRDEIDFQNKIVEDS